MNDSGFSGTSGLRRRFLVLSIAAAAIFLLLFLRLWYLQVIHADRYLQLSEKNRIRYVPISATRGQIFDRDGVLLVDTRPSFDILVLRQDVEDKELLLHNLAEFLGEEKEILQNRWQAGAQLPRFRPFPLAEDVSWETMERIQENAIELPGILADVRPIRSYPYQEMAAHLFGYLGEIAEQELRKADFDGYRPGDYIGKSGVERILEEYLRGSAGERRVEVNVLGKELRHLQTREPIPGRRVFLTIRQQLQQAAEEAFGDQAGAAVVLDVRTGEVLAVASKPSFDPALFARGIRAREWIELLQNSRHPLQDRVIKGQYPPGSTFKMVTALGALQAGVASPNTTVFCPGQFTLGNHDFRCWKKEGHGHTDLKKALKESCDVWFYRVSLDLGIDRMAQMARELGLGAPLGFPLEGERGGIIPDRQWKLQRLGERWYDGETVIAAIGQGYVLTTPLQLAVMTATLANGGTVLRPYIVKRVEDLSGNILLEPSPQKIRTANVAPAHLQAIRQAMDAVVNERGGTAWASRLPEVKMAGKTGTSQVVRLRDDHDDKKKETPYQFRHHGLFVAYAPADDPQIAVAVIVEHGGSGSGAAAPVARAIIANYFDITLKQPVIVPARSGD